MSLLVSRRLGVNVPPNIALVNVSPEPREMRELPVYQRSQLRKPPFISPPPLLLAQRRQGKRSGRREQQRHSGLDASSPNLATRRHVAKQTNFAEDANVSMLSPAERRHSIRLERLRERSGISRVSRNSHVDNEDSEEDTKDETPTDSTGNKEDTPEDANPPAVVDNREYKRNRSCSVQIRDQMKNARKVVNILSNSFKKKRETKFNQMMGVNEKQVEEQEAEARTRKISMNWLARSITKKRMSALNQGAITFDASQATGFQRFRRAARKIKSLIQVCQVCKSITLDQVSGEDWFSKMESIIDSNEAMLSKPQGPSHTRPFITFVQDKDTKELKQLTFDKSLFTRERRADYLLTEPIRNLLKKPASERTVDEENELMKFMKSAAPSFNEYSLEEQRKLLRCMHYDKYEKDRVITRKHLMADGVYFILSGTLVEQSDDKKHLREMKPGERFGDEEIVCGCPRKATIVTYSDVEMMSIHRLDYRTIVHMADDSNDPRYLEICKEDIVFRHFPMRKLIENPGVWTVLSYKYGRLMVKDSNDVEWIYIIKSGEAKVIKHLTTGKVDLAVRRKKVQKKINEQDPHAVQKKMIDFVSERDYLKSQYRLGKYDPQPTKYVRYLHSAPSRESLRTVSSRSDSVRNNPDNLRANFQQRRLNTAPELSANRLAILTKRKSFPKAAGLGTMARRNTSIQLDIPDDILQMKQTATPEVPVVEIIPGTARTENEETGTVMEEIAEELNEGNFPDEGIADDESEHDQPQGHTAGDSETETKPLSKKLTIVENIKNQDSDTSAYINTPNITKEELQLPSIPLLRKGSRASLPYHEDKKGKMVTVPPFVQLESLHAGKVFGLRAVLDSGERGPSASLVSGGCEVLQINKKFFMKHIDDAILSLIKVQYKAFPTEEDLIDRLDNNFQWEEYKQNTVTNFLCQKGRLKQDEYDPYSAEINIS